MLHPDQNPFVNTITITKAELMEFSVDEALINATLHNLATQKLCSLLD